MVAVTTIACDAIQTWSRTRVGGRFHHSAGGGGDELAAHQNQRESARSATGRRDATARRPKMATAASGPMNNTAAKCDALGLARHEPTQPFKRHIRGSTRSTAFLSPIGPWRASASPSPAATMGRGGFSATARVPKTTYVEAHGRKIRPRRRRPGHDVRSRPAGSGLESGPGEQFPSSEPASATIALIRPAYPTSRSGTRQR